MNQLQEIGKLPPQSVDMEEAVIGAMLLENECIADVLEILHVGCIYLEKNASVFKAIAELHHRKESVDILTVTHELKRVNELVLAGGAYRVSELTTSIASSSNVKSHALIVLQQYIRRQMIAVSIQTIKDAYDDYQDPLKVLDNGNAEYKKLYDHISFGTQESTESLLVKIMDDIDSKQEEGLTCSLTDINNIIVRFYPGLKYTIGGRTSMGKSLLSDTFIVDFIKQGAPGIWFTLEVDSKQLVLNITCNICNVDNERMQKKIISEEEKLRIKLKMSQFRMNLLRINDKAAPTPTYIQRQVKKAIKEIGAKWFGVDYIQLGTLENIKGKQKEERVGEFSQAIKTIAKEEHIIGIEVAQVNRGSEDGKDKRPSLHSLKDSGTIEASADVVFLVFRPEYYGITTIGKKDDPVDVKGLAEIIVAKNKQGRTGSAWVEFCPQFHRFQDKPKPETTIIQNNSQMDEF